MTSVRLSKCAWPAKVGYTSTTVAFSASTHGHSQAAFGVGVKTCAQWAFVSCLCFVALCMLLYDFSQCSQAFCEVLHWHSS